MRDWRNFVRSRLSLPELDPKREERIVRELADQLEDFHREGLARGLDDKQADRFARQQVSDWEALARDIRAADRSHLRPRLERWADQVVETGHETKGRWLMFADLVQDARYAWRQLSRNRGFSAVAVLTLALGAGANTAVFSLLDAVLLKKLPVRQPERLVLLDWIAGRNIGMIQSLDGSYVTNPEGQGWSTSFSVPAFREIQSDNRVLESTFAFAELDRLNVRLEGEPEIASGQEVSGDYFAALGVVPHTGRLLTSEDDRLDADPAAVISFAYWRRRFGEDPSAVGRTLFLNGSAFTIVGVTPAGFEGTLQIGDAPDISVPLAMDDRLQQSEKNRLTDETNWWVRVFGRLKPGVDHDRAGADLSGIFDRILARQVPPDSDWDVPRLRVHSGSQGLTDLREQYSVTLFLLQAAAALLLLIACANVSALLLVQSDRRRREVAIRIALGAGRLRLLRQISVESVLLALLGGGLGWVFAIWGKNLVGTALPGSGIRRLPPTVLDRRVFWYTLAVVLATGILAGLAPAYRWLREQTSEALKESPRSGRRSFRLGTGVLVFQIALLVVLLTGAGLLGRTLGKLHQVDYGFDAGHILLGRVDPTLNGYEGQRLANLYGDILERLRAAPGVEHASLVRFPLVSGRLWYSGVAVSGYEPPEGERSGVFVNLTSEDFFETMRIPLLAGRPLSAMDGEQTRRVAVVSLAMAERYFHDPRPIGREFTFRGKEVEVVGVAADTAFDNLRGGFRPTIHIPYRQYPTSLRASYFAVRTNGVPALLAPAMREAVRSADPNLPLFDVKSQVEQIAESTRSETRLAGLSATFGGLALLLVCVGLSGLLSYEVSKRSREIGIRMALGARASNVRKMVVGRALWLLATGVAIGTGSAILLTRYLESLLFGVDAADPLTIGAVAMVLLTTGLLASWIPGRRATQVDPIDALRHE